MIKELISFDFLIKELLDVAELKGKLSQNPNYRNMSLEPRTEAELTQAMFALLKRQFTFKHELRKRIQKLLGFKVTDKINTIPDKRIRTIANDWAKEVSSPQSYLHRLQLAQWTEERMRLGTRVGSGDVDRRGTRKKGRSNRSGVRRPGRKAP